MQRIWLVMMLVSASSLFGFEKVNAKNASMLIDAEQLQKRLGEKALRIIDVRAKEDFAKGHIPGAIRVDVMQWKALVASPNGFRDASRWGKLIGELGLVGEGANVVVYGDKLSNTARVWWMLKYAGVGNASVLDGGWQYWVEAAKATETAVNRVSPTLFKPNFQMDRLEEIDALKQSLDSVMVIDTRSAEEFASGHIDTATRLEWKALVADDGRFKTKAELKRIFKDHNIMPATTAVCYCGSGGRASVEAFALELAGYPKVKVFVGGWKRWNANADVAKEQR